VLSGTSRGKILLKKRLGALGVRIPATIRLAFDELEQLEEYNTYLCADGDDVELSLKARLISTQKNR